MNGDLFRNLCDHVFWSNAHPFAAAGFQHGDVVFCKVDEAWRLLRAARRCRARLAIVTGEGDRPVDLTLWMHKPPQVTEWFGTNMFVQEPHAHAIPLGLGNEGGKKTLSWAEIRESTKHPVERDKLLYANFSPHSNPAVRQPLLDWLKLTDQAWMTQDSHGIDKGAYLQRLRQHHFVLCPPGNGEDTHRMWEALYCGAIPVIRRSPAMEAFRSLPILVVDSLQSITPALLESHMKQPLPLDLAALEAGFWTARITAAKQEVKAMPQISSMQYLTGWWRELLAVRG